MSASQPAAIVTPANAVPLDDLSDSVELLRVVDAQLDTLKNVKADLQRKIKSRLGLAEVGLVDGRPAVTWRRTLRVALSQKLIKALHPEVLADCEEITEVRTFRLTEAV
ncbi:hypothetical protein ACFFQW_49170 [Umezawaea endophytica]|uniref:Uncharacterized protein n=1 Tax=Umezawaea endophytica TaxID=1654476 RepID=A0A9X2VXK7_9PSEU|nr:hypothetical protein [Umezawaea endophytica]MCS7484683.1 hypothetical protein [Umezawaea endophytica]